MKYARKFLGADGRILNQFYLGTDGLLQFQGGERQDHLGALLHQVAEAREGQRAVEEVGSECDHHPQRAVRVEDGVVKVGLD